jgi:YegS/Rv2252/BmrU family lipid kinase
VKQVVVVFNPISGRGRSAAAAEIAAAAFSAAGLLVEVRPTTRAGDARRFASECGEMVDAVASVGGDGTLNEVISGLRRPIPVALIPVGTANVVAREYGIPFAPRRAAELLFGGRTRPIDVARIGDGRFLAMAGVGFDGEIVKAIAAARKGPISQLTYVAPSIRALAGFRPRALRIEVDGETLPGDYYGVIVANTRCYGGHFAVAPDARPDDGLLHYSAWTRPSKWELLRYATAALLRRKSSAARYGAGRRFRIVAVDGGPVAAQADGDPAGATPVEIDLPGANARLFVPAGD